MLKELSALASLMKQAQGMGGKMQALRDRMAAIRCDGQAGAGMVSVEVSGELRVLNCRIDPALVQSGDREMIEELVCAATNQAIDKVREAQRKEMLELTGGLNIPGMSEMFSGLGM